MDEFFKGIGKIKYEGPGSRNPLAYKAYDPNEMIEGKSMKDHLRFSVAYWHSFKGGGSDPFGMETIKRPWDDGTDNLENAKRLMRVNFEFLQKLGVEFYCFHDRDISPERENLVQTNKVLDEVVRLAASLQKDTGIKFLWGTANLFSHPRYMCGASTNPDSHVFAHAAAQVKKAMEVTKELGGSNYVFWGGREGYQTLLNTDMKRELDHLARFLSMAVDYKREIGFDGTLLIEPKPKEPTKHQYDFDVATVLSFLQSYGLTEDFKLNIESNHATLAGHTFEHELITASQAGRLGSVDANIGDLLLGWDTDQFNLDLRSAAFAMLVILKQGGLAPGGLNFDAKLRRESIDPEDLFVAHISSMDTFAQGLRVAARILEEGELDRMVKERYGSYDSGLGAKIEEGSVGFKDLEAWIVREGGPALRSGRQETYESIFDSYLRG
jgi:xylose isomerase